MNNYMKPRYTNMRNRTYKTVNSAKSVKNTVSFVTPNNLPKEEKTSLTQVLMVVGVMLGGVIVALAQRGFFF